MALLAEVVHPARSLPRQWRLVLVASITLLWCCIVLNRPTLHPAMWFLIAGQVVLAIWLVRSPQWGEGRLRWTPQGWCWLSSGRGRVDVNVTPVIDFAGLLCLRLSPLSANSTKNWPESAWVWLHDADPKTKMEFRLALHCMHGHDRSLK